MRRTPSSTRSKSATSTATVCSRSTRRPASRTGWTSGPSRATSCATCRRRTRAAPWWPISASATPRRSWWRTSTATGATSSTSRSKASWRRSGKDLLAPVEIRRYDAGTAADQGALIATLNDRLSRFLTAGDLDGDGKRELIAATFSSGIWLLRPGADPKASWQLELVDADSTGFEHAALIADLDGDGVSELYVASDQHKQVRRYVWKGGKPVRDVIYRRGDARPVFTWNLMPVPVGLIPAPDRPRQIFRAALARVSLLQSQVGFSTRRVCFLPNRTRARQHAWHGTCSLP